jgi:hypothetical protein
MKTGVNIGVSTALSASDAAIQAGQGALSSIYGSETDVDGNLIITIDMSLATSRRNSDGNYYTITFPDDFIGTRGTIDDAFKDARSGVGEISLPASSANLNVILNIPAEMRIGANTANNILSVRSPGYIRTDPSLYFKFNTSDWTQDILTRLNVTVNNHGVLLGAGGSGGWGGVVLTGTKAPYTYPGQGGGGSGQGLHPEHGLNTLGDFYDPNDTTFPAGQAGSGYGRWIGGKSAYGTNGTHGTTESGGAAGVQATDSGISSTINGGRGHDGGSVIYYTSNVSTSTTGTHVYIHNAGWMSAGSGGGTGNRNTPGAVGSTATGGNWVAIHPFGFKGHGFYGYWSSSLKLGGFPGSLFAEDDDSSVHFTLSNTVINTSANTIYGVDGIWAP